MDIRDRDEDDEWFQFIIEEKCGFDFDEYLLNIKSFTREDLEPYLDIIINAIVEYENAYLGFQILALLILETGAILPKEVKESVLWSTNWEFDKGLGVWPESENLRKFCLSDFREKIKNYAPGKRIYFSAAGRNGSTKGFPPKLRSTRMINDFLRKPSVVLTSRIILGALFIYASIDKIIHPLAFAQVIHHYRITPPELINYISIAMPWMELVAGVLLIIGYKAKGSNLIIGAMLIFFIILLSVTAIRGINVSCGCFTTSTAVKSNLIIRIIEDIGMMVLSLHIFLFYKEKTRS